MPKHGVSETVRVQKPPEDFGVLLDDGHVGDNVDESALAVTFGVTQPESQRREGLGSARGHGKREQAWREFSRLEALPEHFPADAIDVGVAFAGVPSRTWLRAWGRIFLRVQVMKPSLSASGAAVPP